jgi:Methyltransferase FkbM domain
MIRILKRRLKELLCRRWDLPYSREEIAFSLLRRIEHGGPISLIDAGAHKGEFTRAIMRVCGVSRGLLIKAMPEKAWRLREEFREPQFSVAAEAKMTSVDLLKLDVQGAECLALAGAAGILKNTRMLWIEVSFKPLYENSATFFDVYHTVEKAGFILADLKPGFRAPDGELLQADALFLKK